MGGERARGGEERRGEGTYNVAENEGDFGLVVGVGEDVAGELVHAAHLSICTYDGHIQILSTHGVMPVPPAIRAMAGCLFASHGYFGIGPLISNR